MANLHTREHDGPQVVESFTPGKQLQKAREALNLTPEEVAQHLRLHVKVINAIEADDYEGLTPAYVRGYMRLYARAVGIDADPLVEAYDKIAREISSVQPRARQLTLPARSQDKLVKAITYLVILILGTLLVVWWQNREAQILPLEPSLTAGTEPKSEPAIPERPSGAPIPDSPQKSEIVSAPGIQPSTADTSSKPEAAIPPDTAVASPQAPEQQATQEGYRDAPMLEKPGTPKVTTPGTAPVALPETTPVATTESPPVIEPSNPPQAAAHTLVLKFLGDSWTEITDSKGQRLYYKLAKGGETVSVQGESPFSLVIGNVPGTTVLYDGKQIDISSFSRRGVARFKVDDTGAHR